ncbi:MAG TPA: hypothetical protein PLF78_10460 [Caulobacter sp.]|nr:hypothetical protein [Caulobacter sp.]
MPASVTAGILLVVAAVIVAKSAAWGLFQRRVMKRTDGLLARRAEGVLVLAAVLAAAAVWLLVARPF